MNKTEVTRITLASICSFPVYLIDLVTRPIEGRLEQQRSYDYMKNRVKAMRKEYTHCLRGVKKARRTEEEAESNMVKALQKFKYVEGELNKLQLKYENTYRMFERWMPWMEDEVARAIYNRGKDLPRVVYHNIPADAEEPI